MKKPRLAILYLLLFALLILGGIALKRLWDLPEYMVLFHLPAAVFLVLGGIEVKKLRQADYEAEVAAVREQWRHAPDKEEEAE